MNGKALLAPHDEGDRPPRENGSPNGSRIRVVLADDHDLVRRSVRLLLESEGDVEVLAESGDLFSALRHVTTHRPHVLLLDLHMRNGGSIDLIRRIRTTMPETQVVVISMEDSPVFARHTLDAGAVGYVLKDSAADELGTAVRRAARGERYVSAPVAAGLDALASAATNDGLTERETEVLRLIALGLTSAEMSERLHLSQRTIESHRRRIHRKLGLTRRWEIVRYALRHRLV
jgi:two-component system, NarL family, response regulator NreC